MNSILKPIFPALTLGATLVLTTPAVQAGSLTPSQIQQLNRGLVRSSSQDFFEEGRRQLDKEIEIVVQRRLTSAKELLKIDKQLRVNCTADDCYNPNHLCATSQLMHDGVATNRQQE